MKGYFLGNMDIEIEVTLQELEDFKKKLKGESGILKHVHCTGVQSEFTLLYEDSEYLIDGLDVSILPDDKGDFKYKIKFADRAVEQLARSGTWGSRYGNGEKIILSSKPLPWDKIPKF